MLSYDMAYQAQLAGVVLKSLYIYAPIWFLHVFVIIIHIDVYLQRIFEFSCNIVLLLILINIGKAILLNMVR